MADSASLKLARAGTGETVALNREGGTSAPFLLTADEILAEIRARQLYSDTGDLALAAWKWLSTHSYHWDPYSGDTWAHAPDVFLNGIGFGYCDDVANTLASILASAGYETRTWNLSGHVVSEVFQDGAWRLFDSDLRALYVDKTGEVVGVEYVASHPYEDYLSNIRNSRYAGLIGDPTNYDRWLLDIYSSVKDNFISNEQIKPLAGTGEISLPNNATIRTIDSSSIPLKSIYESAIPSYALLEVQFGAVDNFEFALPLRPVAITGEGTVTWLGKTFEIGSAELNTLLDQRFLSFEDFSVTATGADNKIIYLASSDRFPTDGSLFLHRVGDAPGEITGTTLDDSLTLQDGVGTLTGGGGDDVLRQVASAENAAAGSRLDGGDGNDQLLLDGTQAYSAAYVSMLGGAGDDVIRAGVAPGQYVGSVRIEGGAGNDLVEVGHLQGSRFGLGYIDGGDGDDTVRVLATLGENLGSWGNAQFLIMGGAGNDGFELEGVQINVLGDGKGTRVDGGAGFDTLYWNGQYSLTIGGAQAGELPLNGAYRRELGVENVEHIDLGRSGASDLHLAFTAADVAAITAGSDFDRTTLALGLTGTGNTLFVDAGNAGTIDLSGWASIGSATRDGVEYGIYQSGDSVLAASFDMILSGTDDADELRGFGGSDAIIGGGGSDTLIGGGGNDMLTGGDGVDVFVFAPGDGDDTIVDFQSGMDRIDLRDYHIASLDSLESWITAEEGGSAIHFDSGEILYLPGIAAGQLERSSFLIDITLTGTTVSSGDLLAGYAGDDVLIGRGGADTLVGGAGDDFLWQTSSLNASAGSHLDGGDGNDRLLLDASQSYTPTYVSMYGGMGDDLIQASIMQDQYVGSVKIEAGPGSDRVELGSIQGSPGWGYVDAGDGDDSMSVSATWGEVGIWSNSLFRIMGAAGDDNFELNGVQVNVRGDGNGTRVDGGSGFDTLYWNGQYNLTIGGAQAGDLPLYGTYRRELRVDNIEHIDLGRSGASGLHLAFTANDVATITTGSDFDQATLNLGLEGVGKTLFVDVHDAGIIDLTDWTSIGTATRDAVEYSIYQNGDYVLAAHVDPVVPSDPLPKIIIPMDGVLFG